MKQGIIHTRKGCDVLQRRDKIVAQSRADHTVEQCPETKQKTGRVCKLRREVAFFLTSSNVSKSTFLGCAIFNEIFLDVDFRVESFFLKRILQHKGGNTISIGYICIQNTSCHMNENRWGWSWHKTACHTRRVHFPYLQRGEARGPNTASSCSTKRPQPPEDELQQQNKKRKKASWFFCCCNKGKQVWWRKVNEVEKAKTRQTQLAKNSTRQSHWNRRESHAAWNRSAPLRSFF